MHWLLIPLCITLCASEHVSAQTDVAVRMINDAGLSPVFARLSVDTPLERESSAEGEIIRVGRAGEVLQLAAMAESGIVWGIDTSGPTEIGFRAPGKAFQLTEGQRATLLSNFGPFVDAIVAGAVVASAPPSPPRRAHPTDLYVANGGIVGGDGSAGYFIDFLNQDPQRRTVKYARFTLRAYNPVGDAVGGVRTVTAVGPVEFSTTSVAEYKFEYIWHNPTISCVAVTRVSVEYMDGRQRTWSSPRSLFEFPEFNDCSCRGQRAWEEERGRR